MPTRFKHSSAVYLQRIYTLLYLLALLAFLALMEPAQAQLGASADKLPIPEVSIIDKVGTDLTSGRRTDIPLNIAIGNPDDPSLWFGYGYKVTGSPIGGEIRVVCVPGTYSSCQSSYIVYMLGDKVEYRIGSGLTDGSIVDGNTVYGADGIKWIFVTVPNSSGAHTDGAIAYLSEVVFPDGRILHYNYRVLPSGMYSSPWSLLPDIMSSDGYEKIKNYVSPRTRHVLVNRRYVSCNPLTTGCLSDSFVWPEIRFEGGGSIKTTTSDDITLTGSFPSSSTSIYNINYSSGNYRHYFSEISLCTPFVGGYVGIVGIGGSSPNACDRITKVGTPQGDWIYSFNSSMSQITSTDPNGGKITSDLTNNSVILTDELERSTTYKYTGAAFQAGYYYKYQNRAISEIDFPEENKVLYSYDSRFNLVQITEVPKPGSGLAPSTLIADYSDTCTVSNYRICGKPNYIIDRRGQRTDFTYDPANGGILTKTFPANADGVRRVQRFHYDQYAAKYYNNNGVLITGSPIWRLTWKKECRTLVSCAGTSDEIVTTFEYDDNLLVAGVAVKAADADGVVRTQRTCYLRDKIGNVMSETKPRAGLSSCS